MLSEKERLKLLSLDAQALEKALRENKKKMYDEEMYKICRDWLQMEDHKSDTTDPFHKLIQKRADILKELAKRHLARVREEFRVPADQSWSPFWPAKHHTHAQVHEESLEGVLEKIRHHFTLQEPIWDALHLNNIEEIYSKSESIVFIRALVTAVIQGLGLEGKIYVSSKRSIAGIEFDIVLAQTKNRVPFAFIEVHRPGNTNAIRDAIWYGKNDEYSDGKVVNRVAGKVWNQLRALQLHGFPSVIGMISSGSQWRIVGLPETTSNSHETLTELLDVKLERFLDDYYFFNDFSPAKMPVSHDDEESSPTRTTSMEPPRADLKDMDKQGDGIIGNNNDEAPRTLLAGPIVPNHAGTRTNWEFKEKCKVSGEEIVEQIALLISTSSALAMENRVLKGICIGKSMSCRIMDPNLPKEGEEPANFGSMTLQELQLHNFPTKEEASSLTRLFILRPLTNRLSTNVYLATCATGKFCCAVKFYGVGTKEYLWETALRDESLWNMVYGNVEDRLQVYTLPHAEGPCLVLPYMEEIATKSEREEVLKDGSIDRALKRLFQMGVKLSVPCRSLPWQCFGRLPKVTVAAGTSNTTSTSTTPRKEEGDNEVEEGVYLTELVFEEFPRDDVYRRKDDDDDDDDDDTLELFDKWMESCKERLHETILEPAEPGLGTFGKVKVIPHEKPLFSSTTMPLAGSTQQGKADAEEEESLGRNAGAPGPPYQKRAKHE